MGFWENRRVLLTGHTGFKGSWAFAWLKQLGARVYGLALPPETDPALWTLLAGGASGGCYADLRDAAAVREAVAAAQPEVVLHMAAQSLVRRSYAEAAATVAVNVMGTVNLLDALRHSVGLKAVLVITSDKVYENTDDGRPFVEEDRLGGTDPYSASKAAAEIVTSSFARSFFAPEGIAVATARAGNVIGGGDWSADRLVPDFWRARRVGKPVELRYPDATRPWQHVLEPVCGYLMHLERLAADPPGTVPSALNFGPDGQAPLTVAQVVEALSERSRSRGWCRAPGEHPPEKTLLAVDSTRARRCLGWMPRLDAWETLQWTVDWYDAYDRGDDMSAFTLAQIRSYQDRLP